MRRLIVRTLLRLCEAQDALRLDHITRSHLFAYWSARLDERWHTGVWTTATLRIDHWADEPVADIIAAFDQATERGKTGRRD